MEDWSRGPESSSQSDQGASGSQVWATSGTSQSETLDYPTSFFHTPNFSPLINREHGRAPPRESLDDIPWNNQFVFGLSGTDLRLGGSVSPMNYVCLATSQTHLYLISPHNRIKCLLPFHRPWTVHVCPGEMLRCIHGHQPSFHRRKPLDILNNETHLFTTQRPSRNSSILSTSRPLSAQFVMTKKPVGFRCSPVEPPHSPTCRGSENI